jgi:AsmA protein
MRPQNPAAERRRSLTRIAMKRPLIWIAAAIALIVVILLVLPFLIPVNQFRPEIESGLTSALGRTVHVGNLSLSIITGSVAADDLSISDDPAFGSAPFLTAKSFKVGVELIPIVFARALHVTGIAIDTPQITLLKNPAGRWNFSSLASKPGAKPSSAAPSSSSSSAPPDLVIGKIELKHGQITLGATNQTKRSVYDDVTFTATNVSLSSNFPISVSAKLPGGGEFDVDGAFGPLDAADAAISPLDAKVKVKSLDLARSGFADPSMGLAGLADVTATLASKSGHAAAQGTATLSKFQFSKSGSPSSTPVAVDFTTDYDLIHSTGILSHAGVKIGKAVMQLAGTFDLHGEVPEVNIKLNAEEMPLPDLEAILPAAGVNLPKGASFQTGTLTLHFTSAGAANKLITSGNVALADAKLAGFDAGSKMSAISALGGVKKASETTIEKLNSDVHAAPDGTQIQNLDMVASGIGEITGGGTISPEGALNFKMRAALSGAGSILSATTGHNKGGIPFAITGTTSDPKFVPDVGGIAEGLVTTPVREAIGNPGTKAVTNSLGGLFGKKKKSNQ